MLMTKKEVLQLGTWPDEFLANLVSPIPSIKMSTATKLVWNCSIHGNYTQTISQHLRNPKCSICGRLDNHAAVVASWMKKHRENVPYPNLEYLRTALDFDETKIYKTTDVFHFICPIHGEYTKTLNAVKKAVGCPICSRIEAVKSTRLKSQDYSKYQIACDHLKDKSITPLVLNGTIPLSSKHEFICDNGHSYYTRFTDYFRAGCPHCIKNWGSQLETKIITFFEQKGIIAYKNKQLVKNPISDRFMELDVYFPDYNVAVEVNGVYWHSIEALNSSKTYTSPGGKQNYHASKLQWSKEYGVQTIFLWEDELIEKFDLCMELIISKLRQNGYKDDRGRIFARKCNIKQVPDEEAKRFYDSYHIQGFGRGLTYGLYHNNELVSCMSFKRCPANTSDCGSWELNRYAQKSGVNVLGGFQRLLTFSHKQLEFNRVVSYADLQVSTGKLYFDNDWKLIDHSKPDYKYVYKGKRYHKFHFRIERFKTDSDFQYKEGLTEFELARLNKLYRVYDCGKLKFEKIWH